MFACFFTALALENHHKGFWNQNDPNPTEPNNMPKVEMQPGEVRDMFPILFDRVVGDYGGKAALKEKEASGGKQDTSRGTRSRGSFRFRSERTTYENEKQRKTELDNKYEEKKEEYMKWWAAAQDKKDKADEEFAWRFQQKRFEKRLLRLSGLLDGDEKPRTKLLELLTKCRTGMSGGPLDTIDAKIRDVEERIRVNTERAAHLKKMAPEAYLEDAETLETLLDDVVKAQKYDAEYCEVYHNKYINCEEAKLKNNFQKKFNKHKKNNFKKFKNMFKGSEEAKEAKELLKDYAQGTSDRQEALKVKQEELWKHLEQH